ncbi:MAG: hypothetical protein GF368_03580 [Candidatus Aenigmarchaeota archaeon]|nr:hypothetical protein [Candidatus Aenigmarchaeota archaeon]
MGYRYIPLNEQLEIPILTKALAEIPGLTISDGHANDYTGGLTGRHPSLGRLLFTSKYMEWEIDGSRGRGVLSLQFVRQGAEKEQGAVNFLRQVCEGVGSPIKDEIYFEPIKFILSTNQYNRY